MRNVAVRLTILVVAVIAVDYAVNTACDKMEKR